MKRPLAFLTTLLSVSLLLSFTTANEAQAKVKLFNKKKQETKIESIDVLNEFHPEAFSDAEQTKQALKDGPKQTKPTYKQKKPDFSNYLIPVDGFKPVNYQQDSGFVQSSSGSISGSVAKDMELNLADCLELALINNPKIKSAYSLSAAYKTRATQSLANYSPKVDFRTGWSRIKADSGTDSISLDPFNQYLVGKIGVSQLVYDFGITQNSYKLSKLEHTYAEGNIEDTVNKVICDVKRSYYYLLLMIEKQRVVQDSVGYFEQTYNQAKAFWEIGVKAKIDVTMAEVNLANARADLIKAKGDVDIAVATLNNAMGLPYVRYKVNDMLPYEKTSLNMREAVEIANVSRPDITKARVMVEITDQGVRLARKVFLPAIQFAGNWNWGTIQNEGNRDWYDVGLYMGFPTINPVLIKAQYDEARYMHEKQTHDSLDLVNQVFYDIQSSYEKVSYTQDRVPAAALAVKKARESFELASGRYKVGEGDAIELKDAQLQYQKTQLDYYSTLFDYNSAKAELERAIGQTIKDDSQT